MNPTSFPKELFKRQDESPDEVFYRSPRFVTHIDDAAIAAVTELYREYFLPERDVLDVMSSWVSHLPEEHRYKRVVGVGMNHEELAANPRLTEFVVQNLNVNPVLPFEENSFDGAGICVSVDYLTQPVDVLRDIGRVLRPASPLVITFSNRCFPTKAIAAWLYSDDDAHLELIASFLKAAGNWTDIQLLNRSPSPKTDPLFAVIARKATPQQP